MTRSLLMAQFGLTAPHGGAHVGSGLTRSHRRDGVGMMLGGVWQASPADDPVIQARIDEAISEWDWSRSSNPSGSLPLLDLVRAQQPSEAADDVDLLFIQHHLATTVPLVQAFVDDGLSVQHVWHADIPYSTNLEAHDQLRRQLGHPERTTPMMTDPLADYTVAQLLRV